MMGPTYALHKRTLADGLALLDKSISAQITGAGSNAQWFAQLSIVATLTLTAVVVLLSGGGWWWG
jgi:hypothetical protein